MLKRTRDVWEGYKYNSMDSEQCCLELICLAILCWLSFDLIEKKKNKKQKNCLSPNAILQEGGKVSNWVLILVGYYEKLSGKKKSHTTVQIMLEETGNTQGLYWAPRQEVWAWRTETGSCLSQAWRYCWSLLLPRKWVDPVMWLAYLQEKLVFLCD